MESTPPKDYPGGGGWLGLAARRVVISIVGGVVLLAGLVMIITPGPGLVVMAAGLAILATEYLWAKRALGQVRRRSRAVYIRARARVQGRLQQRHPRR
ncbi:MAG TPA: PGPGW domain-containing protein [Euzebya sp.]|nr:PGPGW domain-containing protein [Euzebya sp.]